MISSAFTRICAKTARSAWTRSIASFVTVSQADVQLYGLSFSSPSLQSILTKDDESRCALAYCLSFSSDESDFKRNFAQLDSIMKQQLEYANSRSRRAMLDALGLNESTPRKMVDSLPLPRSLEDALRPNKARSIVVTEKHAPFRVVDVNSSWERLCGYTYVESKGKTLGSLLNGPQTDPLIATGMIAKLLQGEDDVGATIINYTKYGRPFRNRIRVGPLRNEFGDVTHYVGLLQEV